MKHTLRFDFFAFEYAIEYIIPFFNNIMLITHKCLSSFEYFDMTFFAFFETDGWEDRWGIQIRKISHNSTFALLESFRIYIAI